MMQTAKPLRQRLNIRLSQLKTERSSWDSHIREVSENLLPRNGRFYVTDRNNGGKRHNEIIDSTGTRSLYTLASGMMAGATSPARPWFKLTTSDPAMAKSHGVQMFLDDVVKRVHRVFQKSNTYQALHHLYKEVGAFGTAATIVMPDPKRVIHHYPLTFGEYWLATDSKGSVSTLYREFELTVSQVVDEFGIDKCSERVKNLFHNDNLEAPIHLVHCIEPRKDRDASKADSENMPFRSVYYEAGSSKSHDLLRESGFQSFPALTPRWDVVGGDVYGMSPGMEVLGDLRQLQHEQFRKGQAIDYQTKPPLQAPGSMINREVDVLPGGVTYVDSSNPNAGIRPSWETNLRLDYLLADIEDVRQRIRGGFYADMFLMLANAGPDTRMTATEVAERHEEKLLMLGPVLNRLHEELLEPLVDMAFQALVERGELPPIPPELQDQDLSVEFVSILAQAQKAIGANNTDRFMGAIGIIKDVKPEVLDRIDIDGWVDSYSDMLGVDPSLLIPKEKAQKLREAKNAMLAAERQAAMAQAQASTVKDLANAPTDSPSALTAMTGYSTPGVI